MEPLARLPHSGIGFFLAEGLAGELGDPKERIGAEGAVATEDVSGIEAMEELVGDSRIVGRVGAVHEAFPTAVGEVDHTHDAHDREAAAGLLGSRLGVFELVGFGVVQLRGAAVDGFDDVPLIFREGNCGDFDTRVANFV